MEILLILLGYILWPLCVWQAERADQLYEDGETFIRKNRKNADHLSIYLIWAVPGINLVVGVIGLIILEERRIFNGYRKWIKRETTFLPRKGKDA